MEFSVLMSIYNKEKSENLIECIESIINQTVCPSEIVIVKDGILDKSLNDVIDYYDDKHAELFTVVSLKENVGLGDALKIGLKKCKYDIVARMDSDDICVSDRFGLQTKHLEENEDVDVVGGNIAEFSVSKDKVTSYRIVPMSDFEIKKRIKTRNPFNHMTVMFRKKSVLDSGSYQRLLYAEDYYLWVRMACKGFKFANINKILVYARTGESMLVRRGNKEFYNSFKVIEKYMVDNKYINLFHYYTNLFFRFIFTNTSPKLKILLYNIFLRQRNEYR